MSKNDILIVTNYFPPETGAASNRIFSLAEQLKKQDYQVKVISPLPNYPLGKVQEGYRNRLYCNEKYKGIKTTRLFIFASNSSNKFVRLFSMLSYTVVLFFYLLFFKTPKRIIIQCSPLFVGYAAVLAGTLKNKDIILNVSDLWPLAGLEMGLLRQGTYYTILEKMERFIYKKSPTIIGQSQEILNHIKETVNCSSKRLFLYRNFPKFALPIETNNTTKDKIKIVYAGLIGVAQGIEKICTNVNFPSNMEFHIYGGGPMVDEVKTIAQKKSNVFFHGSLEREELHKTLMHYDATLIPLKNRIYGSVPSKIFEYSKLGLPILFFSKGEGADLVENLGLGIAIKKIDYALLEHKLQQIDNEEIVLPTKKEVLQSAETNFDLEKQFKNFEKKCLD